MVIQHKCTNCGADMEFDAASGMLKCPSCGLLLNISDMENEIDNAGLDENEGNDPNSVDESWQEEYSNNYKKYFTDGEDVHEFVCQNCGAKLMADSRTTSTKCSFCDAPMVLGNRLTGALAPSYVIPFKISKEAAKKEFDKWRRKAWLAPSGFKKMARLKELAGQYVPFWLYILNSAGVFSATGIKVRSYTQGNYRYTEKSYYNVQRAFNLDIRGIPVDASQKMADDVMDKLEPFDYRDLKEFNTPYLSGFLAEKYDYDDEQMFPRAKTRAQKYTNDYINESVRGYTTITNRNCRMNISPQRTDYVLLPVWMFNYNYNGKDYMFTMNAQTGKVIGKPPISKPRVAAVFLGSTVVITFIMRLISFLLGGGFI